MRRILLGLALGLAIVLNGALPAAAAAARVSIPGCSTDTGLTNVPPGQVIITAGWLAKTKKQVRHFLNVVTLQVNVDGTPLSGEATHWGSIFYNGTYDGWEVHWSYRAGMLSDGEDMVVHMNRTLSSGVSDGWEWHPAGTTRFRCTIHART